MGIAHLASSKQATGFMPPKNLAQPYFANWQCFLHEMLTKIVWLIKKEIEKKPWLAYFFLG